MEQATLHTPSDKQNIEHGCIHDYPDDAFNAAPPHDRCVARACAAGTAPHRNPPLVPEYSNPKPLERTQNWIKFGGNVKLGGEKDVAEGMILGSIQGSLATASALSSWVPELQILDLPFLFRSDKHVKVTIDGNLGKELREKLAAQGFAAPAFINYGARQLLSKEKITNPEQLRGLKIRVIQSPMHAKLWSAFDAIPVGIPITETYNSLSTGGVDAMDLTKSAYAGFKLYEVVPHMTETNHIWASGLVYYASSFWSGLSEEERQVFQLASIEGAAYFTQLLLEDEKNSMREVKAKGCIVAVPEDYEQWRRVAREIWQDYADLAGGMNRIKEIEAG